MTCPTEMSCVLSSLFHVVFWAESRKLSPLVACVLHLCTGSAKRSKKLCVNSNGLLYVLYMCKCAVYQCVECISMYSIVVSWLSKRSKCSHLSTGAQVTDVCMGENPNSKTCLVTCAFPTHTSVTCATTLMYVRTSLFDLLLNQDTNIRTTPYCR